MYNSFGGTKWKERRKIAEAQAEEKQRQEALEQSKIVAKEQESKKKIYLIAGAVAVLGAIIIIIKTRKK